LSVGVIEWRGAINGAIKHVESVCELVVHDVLAAIWKLGAAARCCPRKEHRTLVVGLPRDVAGRGGEGACAGGMRAAEPDVRRMHDHRADVVPLVDVEAQQQHGCLGGDQYLDLLGEFEPVCSFPPHRVDKPGDQHFHSSELVTL
jgi:hypothetical protein